MKKCECRIIKNQEGWPDRDRIVFCRCHSHAEVTAKQLGQAVELLKSIGLFLAGSDSNLANAYSEDIKKLLGEMKNV